MPDYRIRISELDPDYLRLRRISLAEISYYQFLLAPKCFFDNTDGAKASLQNCPRLKAALEATDALPELKVYLAQRKDTMM